MSDVLVASWLEPEQVRTIAAVPGVSVSWEPELLPRPRYPADHNGPAPRLSASQQARWELLLSRAEICFDLDWWRPAELPRTAPALRWVQLTSAGVGQFLARTGLAESGIVFTTAAGAHAVPLAEFTLAGLLHLVKGVPDLTRWQRLHRWDRYATAELRGRRALVVGPGSIGREVTRLLDAFGVTVTVAARPTAGERPPIPGAARMITTDQLDAEVPEADIVVLTCPLTDQTRGLLSAQRIARLPRGAMVVNVARGPVLDEPALVARLASGDLGGAVLDVFDTEPLPADSPLWDMDNVLISPHSASTVADENDRIVDLFCDNLRRDADRRPLRNVFDAARGY